MMQATGVGGPSVDPDHPWLGLHPFGEENQHYFFGRTTEIRDIFLRVREEPLTVLYGQSGLGKTSLLRAGLMPKLRIEGFRPVRLLLDFSADSGSLIAQARAALAEACSDGQSPVTLLKRWTTLDSLWEIFSHEELRPPDLVERVPALIFDQFEEVFTLGEEHAEANDPRRAEVAELFTQLADLVENRAPAALQRVFETEPQRALDYEFGPTRARVVLALREDYLAQLEEWKSTLPSLMRNRMPLRLLTGPPALEAVVRPGRMEGRNLVSDEVGAQIVRFVARRTAETPLEEIEAVPPLVSLLCERLNDARLAHAPKKLEHISAALVDLQGANILQRFYVESFEPFQGAVREAVREYVEDRMVTVGGHRNPVALEDACAELASRGVPSPEKVIDALIERRLLTAERRGGIQRLEITHDVLCPLVVGARKDRHERRTAVELARQRTALRHARRTALAFAVLGLLALGAFAAAVIAWYRAEAATQRAKMAKQRADELITYLQYDLSEALGKLGRLDMMEAINTHIIKYHEDHPPETGDLDAFREKSVALIRHGDVKRAQGDLAGALQSYRDSLGIAEKLAKQDPGNTDWQRDLSISYNRVGDVQRAQGDLAGALQSYRDSFGIAEKLAKQDLGNADWQRDLSISYNRVGDVEKARGNLAGAFKSYRDSLGIREKLAKQDPGNASRQRDLSVSYDNVGDVQRAQGDLAGALQSYRDSLGIRAKLAKQDPHNAGWQRDLSLSYESVGDVESAQDDLAGALQSYRDSLAIRAKLAKQDPGNTGWQRDLSLSYESVGDVESAQDDLAGALQSYRDSLAIRAKLAKQDPGNAGWQRDLSVSYERVGDLESAQGDLAGALQSYRDSLGIAEKLAKQDPHNAGWQRDLSVSHNKVGNVQRAQGDLAGALQSYRDSLGIAEKLAKQDPHNADWQRDLSVSYNKVGDVQRAQGDLVGALQSYRDSLGIAEKLAKQDPHNIGWQRDLAWIYWRTGSAWADVEPKSKNEARAMVEKGRDILRPLMERTGWTANQQEWLDSIEADLRKLKE